VATKVFVERLAVVAMECSGDPLERRERAVKLANDDLDEGARRCVPRLPVIGQRSVSEWGRFAGRCCRSASMINPVLLPHPAEI
jgi:hypothetical protein